GLLRDARDGGTIQQVNKGKKGRQRLYMSYKAVQGVKGSVAISFPIDVFETVILDKLREIKPSEILPQPRKEVDRTIELGGRKAELEIDIEKMKNRLAVRYSDDLADVLERQRDELKVVAAELAAAKEEAASPLGEAWGDCKTLLDALKKSPNE